MSAIEELVSLWEERQERGTPSTPEDLCRDCPELADELRWHIRALQAVDSHFGVTLGSHLGSTTKQISSPATFPLSPVRIASEYQIERLHASGGLGNVFLATDSILNRKVAIKFPKWGKLSLQHLARFEREALITGRLDHPGIVPVHSLKQDDASHPCYVMRFIDGPTFAERVQQIHRTFNDPTTRLFFEQLDFRRLLQNFFAVCNIVGYAHGQGVIHRDIKPHNIIIGQFGDTLLVDWGLAKVVGQACDEGTLNHDVQAEIADAMQTQSGALLGTPAFASPEQLLGQTDLVDFRSDTYSLGATLYFLLTGIAPIEKKDFEGAAGHATHKSIKPAHLRNPCIPRGLSAICVKAMERDRDARYQTASELTRDLEQYLLGEPISAMPDSVGRRFRRFVKKRPRLMAASIAAALVTIIAGVSVATILGQKNRELTANNSQLQSAIVDTRSANKLTLVALRSLVDDVVIRDLSQDKTLDTSERQFLNNILSQYTAVAAIQGQTIESRAIRAEGLKQMGKIHLRLSDEDDALRKLESAVELYRQIVSESDKPEYRIELANGLAELSDALMRLGRLDQAHQQAHSGILLLDEQGTESIEFIPVMAHLYRILGNVQQRQRHWDQARKSLESSMARLKILVSHDQQNALHKQSLAAVYRNLSETSAQLGDVFRQIEYSKNALTLERTLVDQFPDRPEHQLGLALAINHYSMQREFAGETSTAIEELTEAASLVSKLSERFPKVATYREALGSIHLRRGSLYFLQDEPAPAGRELTAATAQFRSLNEEFPAVSDYAIKLLQTQSAIGDLKIQTARIVDAQATFEELFQISDGFKLQFPEVVSRGPILPLARINYARILLVLHQYEQARQNLSSAITDLQVVRQNDQTAFPKLYLVRARRFLGMALVGLKNADGAIAEIELAASMAADLAVTESKNYVLLNSLASEHLGLAELYATLKCPELAARHREIQTKLLSNIIDGFPSNPFYRCQAAQAFVNQAYPCILRKEFDVARQCLTNAEMVLQRSATEHANDLVVRKTLGNLRSGIGRWHFHQGQFELALTEFTAAGLLFPSADNLAAKAVALAHVNPEEALAVIELITNIETPSRRPLKNLLDACGHASKKTTDERLVARLGDQAVRLLQHMKNENYVSQFSTIDQLNRSPTFSKLREREDFVDLVAELTERHKLLHAPADQPSLGPDRN